jgi:BASS family bile acid:Na+ symporter
LVATTATYALSFGLPQAQKSVLTLGISTRNLGAALVPLFAIPGVDQRAIVMVVIGVPMQMIASFLAARWLARRAIGEPGAAHRLLERQRP